MVIGGFTQSPESIYLEFLVGEGVSVTEREMGSSRLT